MIGSLPVSRVSIILLTDYGMMAGLDIKQFGPLAQGASRFEKLLAQGASRFEKLLVH